MQSLPSTREILCVFVCIPRAAISLEIEEIYIKTAKVKLRVLLQMSLEHISPCSWQGVLTTSPSPPDNWKMF